MGRAQRASRGDIGPATHHLRIPGGALIGAMFVAGAAAARDGAEVGHRLDGVVVAVLDARVDSDAKVGRPEERLLGRQCVAEWERIEAEVLATEAAQ